MTLPIVIATAIALLQREEGCHLHAYPDPLSPLGKAIRARGINHMGRTGEYPDTVTDRTPKDGNPWTIGYGTTGAGINRTTRWTQAQCNAALIERAQHAHSEAARIWPGLHELHTNAQAALISLVYNRGATRSTQGPRGVEMREIAQHVRAKDYAAIADCIRRMKRIWPTVPGLMNRREREAVMVEKNAAWVEQIAREIGGSTQ